MPYVRIWVHVVWSTKHRKPLLTKEVRPILFNHIKENACDKRIFLAEINGYDDHVHCLISLRSTENIAKVVNLLKGESSHWANSQNLTTEKLTWQTEYFAISVGESEVARVRNYIRRQERHHAKHGFIDEITTFSDRFGFEIKIE